jgi:hypothetical protein
VTVAHRTVQTCTVSAQYSGGYWYEAVLIIQSVHLSNTIRPVVATFPSSAARTNAISNRHLFISRCWSIRTWADQNITHRIANRIRVLINRRRSMYCPKPRYRYAVSGYR